MLRSYDDTPNTSLEERSFPTPRRALVAAFVCPELERLGREVGFPVAVLDATTDVARHAARLAATFHGAWTTRAYADWPLPFDEGVLLPHDLAYRHLPFDARWMGPVELPTGLVMEDGCLGVRLPEGTFVADLAKALRAGLVDVAFDNVARRPSQVRRRYASGRPVVVHDRYSLMEPGAIERVRVADDLCFFRPRDLPKVAEAVSNGLNDLALRDRRARCSGACATVGPFRA